MKRFWNKLKDSAAESRGINFDDPFQGFTPRARNVFHLAGKHSERLRHNFIGTEHLLLGLLESGQGVAWNVLKRVGVDLEGARREVEQCVGLGPDQPCSIPSPFTPRLKRVLELAHQERRMLHHTYLGTEHLLLGILKEGHGVAARVLKQRELELDQVRHEVLEELDPNFAAQEDSVITSLFVEKGNPELQDRVQVLDLGSRIVFAVADGAGGISGGAQAAESFVQAIAAGAAHLRTAEDCQQLLMTIDQELVKASDCGETTGVVAVISAEGVVGASVGDSAAWLFTDKGGECLTLGSRKPFLGSGTALAISFSKQPVHGILVIATDGLWKYTSLEAIAETVRTVRPEFLAEHLAQLARLKSGAFPDDIAIATVRIP